MSKKAMPTKRPITTWEKAPVLMTTNYAALVLNIAPNTLRHMVKRGEVPVKRMGEGGRVLRFEKYALMEWAGVKEN